MAVCLNKNKERKSMGGSKNVNAKLISKIQNLNFDVCFPILISINVFWVVLSHG